MQWTLRLKAAERGIWKSTELRQATRRRRLGDLSGEDVGIVDGNTDHDPPR